MTNPIKIPGQIIETLYHTIATYPFVSLIVISLYAMLLRKIANPKYGK